MTPPRTGFYTPYGLFGEMYVQCPVRDFQDNTHYLKEKEEEEVSQLDVEPSLALLHSQVPLAEPTKPLGFPKSELRIIV